MRQNCLCLLLILLVSCAGLWRDYTEWITLQILSMKLNAASWLDAMDGKVGFLHDSVSSCTLNIPHTHAHEDNSVNSLCLWLLEWKRSLRSISSRRQDKNPPVHLYCHATTKPGYTQPVTILFAFSCIYLRPLWWHTEMMNEWITFSIFCFCRV